MRIPLDPGGLPANVVVRLAPFSEAVLQHFIYGRPTCSESRGRWRARFLFKRGDARPRVTPTHRLRHRGRLLRDAVEESRDAVAVSARRRFCGDRNLQMSRRKSISRVVTRHLLDHGAQGIRCHRDPG